MRAPCIDTLARDATRVPSHLEPAYRQGDGALAIEGALGLPCRADVISQEGISAGQALQVDSETQLKFEAVTFVSGAGTVVLSPFVWDGMPLEVPGLSEAAVSNVLQS